MNFAMTETETKEKDSIVEKMINGIQNNKALTEQLALDSVRLLSCTEDNYKKIQNQGFFKRCWSRMSGEAGKLERENTHSLIEMQKIGFRYLNMLQQKQLLQVHSILTIKNNLKSLAIKELETQQFIDDLAKAVNDRFIALERRVDDCETNNNLQDWLLTLEERDLDTIYPTPHIRLLEVINQFYQNKSDNWNSKDLLFMKKALRTVSIDPKQQYSVESFIKGLVHEILINDQFQLYEEELNRNCNLIEAGDNFIIDEVSSPLFMTMHSIKNQYEDRMDSIEELKDELNISTEEALTRILCRKIKQLNINISYSCPIAESGIEILGAMRLSNLLKEQNQLKPDLIEMRQNQDDVTSSLENDVQSKELDNLENVDNEISTANLEGQNNKLINIESFSLRKTKLLKIPGFSAEKRKLVHAAIFYKGYFLVSMGANEVYWTKDFDAWTKLEIPSSDLDIRKFINVRDVLYGINPYSKDSIAVFGVNAENETILGEGLFAQSVKLENNVEYSYNLCNLSFINKTDFAFFAYTSDDLRTFTREGFIFDDKKEEYIRYVHIERQNQKTHEKESFNSKDNFDRWDCVTVKFDDDNNKCFLVLIDHYDFVWDDRTSFDVKVLCTSYDTFNFIEVLTFTVRKSKFETTYLLDFIPDIISKIDGRYYISSYDTLYSSEDGEIWDSFVKWKPEKNILNVYEISGFKTFVRTSCLKLKDLFYINTSRLSLRGLLLDPISKQYKILEENKELYSGFVDDILTNNENKIVLIGDKNPVLLEF